MTRALKRTMIATYMHMITKYNFLTGEVCSTCTAVRGAGGVWCVCVITRDIVNEEVIEVDELDKGNISTAPGKQHE